jgi:putative ABC transport system permease protein
MSASTLQQNLRVGLDALRANPLRTVLSTLGVIIGVGSLVAVLSVGDGMEVTMREQLDATTSVLFFNVAPITTEEVDGQQFPLDSFPVFTVADVREAARIDGLAGLTGEVTARAEATDAAGRVRRMVSVWGVTESWQAMAELPIAAGRMLTADDVNDTFTPRVVLSQALAARFVAADSLASAEQLLDRTILLEGTPFTVQGIIADSSRDENAWVSLATVHRALPPTVRPRAVTLSAKFADVVMADSVRARVARWADAKFGPGTTRVRSNESRLAQAAQGILLFKLFMGAITGISLLVGGIGIMNVMLASVTERTREIGIRKAVGASRGDVRSQFLAESVAIASFGSAVGVALGLTAAFGITALMRAKLPGMGIQASVSWSTILVAVASAAFVGLVFGTYPARRAARLDPIDAIRHE